MSDKQDVAVGLQNGLLVRLLEQNMPDGECGIFQVLLEDEHGNVISGAPTLLRIWGDVELAEDLRVEQS